MLPTIEQDPINLSFGLVKANIHLELTVLQEHTVNINNWQFVFQIVGESHRVLVYYKGQLQQQEVLACIPLRADDCVHHATFDQLQNYQLDADSYQFDIRFSTEIVPLLTQVDMEVGFPQVYGGYPVTQLCWEDNGHLMRWRTLHLYPRAHDTVTVLTYSEYNYLQAKT